MKKGLKLLLSSISAFLLLGVLAAPITANEVNQTPASLLELEDISQPVDTNQLGTGVESVLDSSHLANHAYLSVHGSTISLFLPTNMDVLFSSPTNVRVINRLTNQIEVLPTQMTTPEGIRIVFVYTQTDYGLSIEMVFTGRWIRCALGTLGMAGTGVLGGAAAGSALPVLGTTGGGIAGGIFGAAVGAATFCF